MLPAVLTRETPGSYDPITDTYTSSITEAFPCRGFVEAYSTYTEAARHLQPSDRKVLILAATLGSTPQLNDRVELRGEVFTVGRVDSDPAQATWVLQGHPA